MKEFLAQNQWIAIVAGLWTWPWKGVALWKAAKNSHKYWFIALLVVNSLAILDILYIFIFSNFSKKKSSPEQNSNTR